MEKSKIDQAVMKLLEKIKEKESKLNLPKKRTQWKTNCTLKHEEHKTTNIQTIRDFSVLIDICAALLLVKKNTKEASETLGLVFKNDYLGYPIDDWIYDLKTRVNMLKLEEEKKEIKRLNDRINNLVSEDQRRELELKEIENILKE